MDTKYLIAVLCGEIQRIAKERDDARMIARQIALAYDGKEIVSFNALDTALAYRTR